MTHAPPLQPSDVVVLLARTVRGAIRDDFGIAASSIAFAAFLALIPLSAIVASAYGLVASDTAVEANVARLAAILPPDARRLVAHALRPSGSRVEGATLLGSTVVALFSARRAGRSLLHGINLAYRIERQRRGLRRQLAAMLLVLGCAALVLTALVSLSVLAFIQSYVPDGLPGAGVMSTLVLSGALAIGAGGALILIYRYAPACEPIGWRDASPGTVVAVLLWLAATLAFRAYVERIARFDDVYGPLSAVVMLLLWLMVSAWVLLVGARLNAEAMAGIGFSRHGART